MADKEELRSRIDTLDAYMDSLVGDAEPALHRLADATDPDSFLQHLAILIRKKRFAEACELIDGREPDALWCHQAIVASLLAGNQDMARQLHAWSEEQLTGDARDRCRLYFSEWLTRGVLEVDRSSALSPLLLSSDQRDVLRDALRAVSPIVDVVRTHGYIEMNLELLAVERTVKNLLFLGDREACPELCQLIEAKDPAPLQAGEFAVGKVYTPDHSLAERLRKHYPDMFRAQWLACVIDAELFDDDESALSHAMRLVPMAATREDREQLAALIADVLPPPSDAGYNESEATIDRLLEGNPARKQLFDAQRLIKRGEFDAAADLLECGEDDGDPLWLQLSGQLALTRKDTATALERFQKAAELIGDIELFKRVASLAFSVDDFVRCNSAINSLLQINSNDVEGRTNAVWLAIKRHDYADAVKHLRVLRQTEPENEQYALNLAFCLAHLGEAAECLEVYETLCASERPSVSAIIGRSEIKKSLNHPKEAFALLDAHRDAFWDDPLFVQAYLAMAWPAREDAKGHEALVRLQQLQETGKAPAEVLERKSLDDLLQHAEEYNERRETIARQLLVGQLPWTLAEWLQNRTTYDGWHFRTQRLRWIVEDPTDVALLSAYASNAFAVGDSNGRRELVRIRCSPRGAPVVCDLSSLIVLHDLGLLEQAADYFGEIVYPSGYLELVLPEASRLVYHQPSYQASLEEIKMFVDRGVIQVVDDIGSLGNRPFPYIDEYSGIGEDAEHFYRLHDLLRVLEQRGQLGQRQKDQLLQIHLRASGADDLHPHLVAGAQVLVARSTLQALADHKLLADVTACMSVHMSRAEYDGTVVQLDELSAQRCRREAHERLWAVVKSDTRFTSRSHTSLETGASTGDGMLDLSVASASLAQELGLPLLADDRVVQTLVLNSTDGAKQPTCCTADLVFAIREAGLITEERYIDVMLTMMHARVRFTIPPVALLLAFAVDNRENLPGHPLRETALYMHDCIRDPGLFTGMEPTDPPMSMAFRLIQEWSHVLAELLISAWNCVEMSDSQCQELTAWLTREAVPSLPPSIQQSSVQLADVPRKLLMARVLIGSTTIEKQERARLAVLSVRQGLGFEVEQYRQFVCEVLHEQ